ncbi:hypothetical protein PaecuDRAFT_0831 [Paenibacillus curdlanolyticus YK9]|uniref:Uncharacterized protein n=1 Tax=Paenibacillus curdlanolyticus YK9 TaxID=717606 RepID=E0I5A9_9BACL|nr:hypothetical protein PaecuDRAFT_0831 [Paenibacillus curdlanolyticus YK9]
MSCHLFIKNYTATAISSKSKSQLRRLVEIIERAWYDTPNFQIGVKWNM